MTVQVIVFAVFAIAAVAGGLVMVMARNPVHSALGLLTAMFSVAVFYVLNGAYFVAVVQVLIYAGAVMTLFVFVIMLIGGDQSDAPERIPPLQRWSAVGLGGVLLGVIVYAISGGITASVVGPSADGTIENISQELFGTWMLAFESTVLLLTIAAVGTIALGQFAAKTRSGEELVADVPLQRPLFDPSRYELETGTGTGNRQRRR